MNSPLRPPVTSIVPENAPFTTEQRTWLNGFFAGLLEGEVSALSAQDASALMPGLNVGGLADVMSVVLSVPGVSFVRSVRLFPVTYDERRQFGVAGETSEIRLPPQGVVVSYQHNIVTE